MFMRNLGALIALLLLLLIPAGAQADTVAAGDYVKFGDRAGSPGGEFLLTVYDTPGGPAIDRFITFCLQMTEYMNYTDTFVVGGVSTATDDQPADPLDQRTAYLYTQFRNGSLANYNYGPGGAGDATSANLLQNASWYFEGENVGNQSGNIFVQAANAAVNNGSWSGLGTVKVLNLFFQDGRRAQDQLTMVPEPSTMILLGSGVAALCLRRRRTGTA
jgi:hypothetical protein